MNETTVSPASATTPPEAQVPARPSRWTGGRITGLVIGILLALVSLILLGGGGTGLWAELTQRDAGYVTTGVHHFSTGGSALVTERTHLGGSGVGWLYSPGILGKVRIRVTPASGSPLFVGIGPSKDVDRYLARVSQTVITDFFKDKVETVGGSAARSRPGTQSFWVASTAGSGPRTLFWQPKHGSWSVVVMNASARPGFDIRADLGARMPAVVWIVVGLLIGGALFLAGGALLIVGAIRNKKGASHAER